MRPLETIVVFGLASQKELGRFPIDDPTETLMFFLMRQGLPIASSCAGDGICRKCVVNQEVLSCQSTVGEWLSRRVEVSYL